MTMPDHVGTPARIDLPIPEYDHLPIGSLASRIRSLDQDELQALLDYETSHGNRLPATQTMSVRLDELRNGAQPSGGDPTATQPETLSSSGSGMGVTPQTAGPTPQVDFEGVPGEPRRPHSGRSNESK
jgi:hypothetical protein